MPTMNFGNVSFFPESNVLASDEDIRHNLALTIAPSSIAPIDGRQTVRPGSVLYKLGSEARVNIRTSLKLATTSGATTTVTLADEPGLQYSSKTARFFKPGDVLQVTRPMGTVTLALTWAAADTVTVTVAGQPITYAATSGTLADIATGLAAKINATPPVNQLVEAIAAGAIVYLFSQSNAVLSLTVAAVTDGNGTATASGAALVPNAPLGTIDANGVNAAAGTVTLAAAAGTTLPIGAPVGIAGAVAHGLVVNSFEVAEGQNDISSVYSAFVWGERLPYWDGDIAAQLPEIRFA